MATECTNHTYRILPTILMAIMPSFKQLTQSFMSILSKSDYILLIVGLK